VFRGLLKRRRRHPGTIHGAKSVRAKPIARYAISFALILALLGHVTDLTPIAFINRLDAIVYDAKLRLTMPNRPDSRLVIVDIDEKSLAEVGRWPWNRKRMAELVTQVFDHYGAGLLAMDVVFAEPDDSVELTALDDLERGPLKGDAAFRTAVREMRPRLDYDGQFAAALRRHPVVLGYFLSHGSRSSGALPPPVLRGSQLAHGGAELTHWSSYSGNLPRLQSAAAAGGHMEPVVDLDGVLRRVPLLAEHDGDYYEALALAVVRQVRGQPPVVPGIPDAASDDYASMEWIDLPSPRGSLRIPVDASAAALVPYRGYEGTFRYVSAVDVLKGRLDADALHGRIVLLGTTTLGLKDARATPVGGAFPGVEVQANLIAGMLDGTLKQRPRYLLGADALLFAAAALILVFVVPRLSPWRATLATLAVAGTLTAINLGLWQYENLVLPVAASLFLVVALYTLNMSYGYIVTSRDKRLIAGLFGQYVPPELVREMARNPAEYSLAGRSAELSVMFCDIHAFTRFSESLEPQQLTQLMNEYLTAMTGVIRSQRGTLDKYVGDAIMAFWGAPVDDPEHALHAVATALGMQRELVGLNRRFAERGLAPLRIGIGINTGTMTVGDMGSAVRKAYTVLGDAVNVGSRLENLTRHYGVGIIVGEDTRRTVDGIAFRELDQVRVKGRVTPLTIYEPLGETGNIGADRGAEIELWSQALARYRSRDWNAAQQLLETLATREPDCGLYRLFLKRIEAFRATPPGDDWNGVTTFETK
jgi:adenylate cyclase